MSEKNCGNCEHFCPRTTHKYDDKDPPTEYSTCRRIPCVVFGEYHYRCSASALVTPDFSCSFWEAK